MRGCTFDGGFDALEVNLNQNSVQTGIVMGNHFNSTLLDPLTGIKPKWRIANTIDRNDGRGVVQLD